MKTKIIQKMLSGGGMPPFTYYTPITVSNTSGVLPLQQQLTNLSIDTKGLVTDKDLFDMLEKIDGLPNDMQVLVEDLNKLYLIDNLFSDGLINTSQISSRYLNSLYKLKVANFNKKLYDTAYNKINEEGGLNEIAITDTGKIVVRDKDGNIEQISSEEYLNNKNNYQALTNSNLLSLRAYNPELAFLNNILGVVENGIGVPTITKIIDDTLKSLGTTTVAKEGYSLKQANQILSGIEILREAAESGISLDGMSLDGLYKSNLLTENQIQLAKQAIRYIYNTLPINARTLLEVKSGNTNNPRKGALDLLTNLVISKTSSNIDFDLDYKEKFDDDKKSEKSTKIKNDDIKSNPIWHYVKGTGGERTTYHAQKTGKGEISVRGEHYNPIDIANNKRIGLTNLNQFLTDSGIGSIISQNGSILFGNLILDFEDMNNIIYRGTGITRVELPILILNGKTVPDFSILDKFEKALDDINKLNPNLTKEEKEIEIAKIYANHELYELLNQDGSINYSRFGLFLIADAYGVDINKKFKKDDDFLEEIVPDNATKKNIETVLGYEIDHKNWWDFWYDNIYKSTIFIPIINNENAAITGYGDQVKTNIAYELDQLYQTWIKQKNLKSTDSDNL